MYTEKHFLLRSAYAADQLYWDIWRRETYRNKIGAIINPTKQLPRAQSGSVFIYLHTYPVFLMSVQMSKMTQKVL